MKTELMETDAVILATYHELKWIHKQVESLMDLSKQAHQDACRAHTLAEEAGAQEHVILALQQARDITSETLSVYRKGLTSTRLAMEQAEAASEMFREAAEGGDPDVL